MSSTTEQRAAAVAAVAAAAPSRVDKSTIERAVSALLKYKAAQSVNEKPQLLTHDDYFYLNLSLKKIPSNPRKNPYGIPLPSPVLDASASEVCLIIDDRPRTTTPPSDQMKKLIKSQNIPISKVIRLSKLKANYKPFEARRKLCDSYDMFLVDKRVVHLLPKLIGKEFFRKKKLPLGVDLGKKNLKLQVERILGSALLFIGTGTCSVMKVGKMEMEKDEIVENVFEAIKGAIERVPKKWDGVRSLHLKFSDSVALPIYQALPEVRLKIEGLKEIEEAGEVTEVSDNDSAKSGKKTKKKGRIHEVRYMDAGEDVDSDVDEEVRTEVAQLVEKKGKEEALVQSSDDDTKKKKAQKEVSVGRKKRKSKTHSNVDEKNKKTDNEETVGKKRRKSKTQKKGALGDLNGDDEIKKTEKDQSVGKKGGKAKTQKEGVLGDSNAKKQAKNAKSEEASGGKMKGGEVSAETKRKKKSELGNKSIERISKVKDVKKKVKVSSK